MTNTDALPAAWTTATPELIRTAVALLLKIDNMTTEEFQHGGEREEREALREALLTMAGIDTTGWHRDNKTDLFYKLFGK